MRPTRPNSMLTITPKTVLPIVLAMVLSNIASAAELGGSFSVGIEHDSNVGVDELDRSSNLSDLGRLISFGTDLKHDFSDTTSARIIYDFSTTSYAEFEKLSRKTHSIGGSINRKFDGLTAGLSYFLADTKLDNQSFLAYQRISPSLSGFATKRWFFRGAYVFGDKTLERRPGRDSSFHSVETEGYYFWRGLRRYLNLGYAFRDEDSRADRFDYKSHLVKVRFVERFQLGESLSTLEIGARYEKRDYSAITPSIGQERFDNRTRVLINFDHPLTPRLHWRFYGDYSDYKSNVPSADYEQLILGSAMEWRF